MKSLYKYFFKIALLFAPIYCINCTNKIVYCSLYFTLSMLIANWITKTHSSKKALLAILWCTCISFALVYKQSYCIAAGKPISGLIAVSLSTISVAWYVGTRLFLKLEKQYGFVLANSISLCIAFLLDHFVMAIFFIRLFSIHKVALMLYKEVGYTFLFSFLIYLSILIALYIKYLYSKRLHYGQLLISKEAFRAKTSLS